MQIRDQRRWVAGIAITSATLVLLMLATSCRKRTTPRGSAAEDTENVAAKTDGDGAERLAQPSDDAPGAEKPTVVVSSSKPAAVLGPSLSKEAEAAIGRSLDWLAAHQKPNGAWSDEKFPALTALPLWAFANSDHPKKKEVIDKAVKFILTQVRDNGGIYADIKGRQGGGLSNYNTALCMTALHATGRPDLVPIVQKARKFIADGQHIGGDIYKGGFGYDRATGRAYTDGIDTLIAAEAMVLTADVEDTRDPAEGRVDADWKSLREYAKRLQNTAEDGKDEEGGFIYRPDESKAGSTTNADGRVVFRAYGSMTYGGLLMLMYAKVPRNDPRVKSAFDWSIRHWSLDENPGMGAQGLYFFYNVLVKALSAYGQDQIEPPGGKAVAWRAEVVKKVLESQKIDPDGRGYWVNATGRFWEANPVLTTSYAVQTLQIAAGQ